MNNDKYDKCNLCKEIANRTVIVFERIGKVYSVEGKDMTEEFFRAFTELRFNIYNPHHPGEKDNGKTK